MNLRLWSAGGSSRVTMSTNVGLEVGYGVARIRLFRKLTERMNKTR